MAQTESEPKQDGKSVEVTVLIDRTPEQVFGFYRDFRNLPKFLGDVMTVEITSQTTSQWTIEGPLGVRIHWTINVVEECLNEYLRYETAGSPETHVVWEIYFANGTEVGKTELREVMWSPLGAVGRAAMTLIGKDPGQEIKVNLCRLKQLLETGTVTDKSHAVHGKFEQH